MARSQGWLGGNRLIAYFAIAIIAVFAAVMLSGRKPPTQENKKLSGTERDDFVASGVRSCINRQRALNENKDLAAGIIEKYCACYVQGLADAFTVAELKHFAETKQSGPIKGRSDQVSNSCVARVQ